MGRRIWLVGGSIGAGVILILMAFTSVVNAQTTASNKKTVTSNLIDSKNFKEKQKILSSILSEPGRLIQILFTYLEGFIIWFYVNIWLNLGK